MKHRGPKYLWWCPVEARTSSVKAEACELPYSPDCEPCPGPTRYKKDPPKKRKG
jgi:hypothetical protein